VPRSGAAPTRDHAVLFYDHATHAADSLTDYVAEGLQRGDGVIAVLTPPQATALRDALEESGDDAERAAEEGRFVLLDAATTLESFVVDGAPDARLLTDGVGAAIKELGAGGRAVRAAGEMVAVLWAEGNLTGALALETVWNELADTLGFGLLCPYPSAVLDSGHLGHIGRLCALHTGVVAPASYASGWDPEPASDVETGVFVPAPEAVGATRRRVAGAMAEWSATRGLDLDDQLVSDACLVASEMAANAVTHARSAFEVDVACSDGAVRVTVSDIGPGAAEEHRGAPLDLGGRGLTIVAEVADRWGCDTVAGGKVVWAELTTRQLI
jgi:anti-sigma regulatory factor (Ser/Thr protein kinase)